MLISDLLKNLTPETLVYMLKSNPLIVQSTLYKFDSYKAFAEALTNHQQAAISSNLYKLGEFFKTTEGKESINTFVNHFVTFTTKK
jgi:hypothetical protein